MLADATRSVCAMADVPIFSPRNPIRGMNTFLHPSALPQGFASLVRNLVADNSALVARPSISEFSTSGIPGGSEFRGAAWWKGAAYAAYKLSSGTQNVGIYKSTDFATWTEVTSSSTAGTGLDGSNGTFGGNNRLVDTGAFCSFAAVSAFAYPATPGSTSTTLEQGRDLLIVSNGDHSSGSHSSPRVLNGEAAANPETAQSLSRVGIHNPIGAPAVGSTLGARFGWSSSAVLKDHRNTSFPLQLRGGTQGTITNVTNASPAVVTTSAAHGLATGDEVAFEGVLGSTGINNPASGRLWNAVTVLSPTTFEVYTDDSFVTPVAAGGAYISGGRWWKKPGAYRWFELSERSDINYSTTVLAENGLAFTANMLYMKTQGTGLGATADLLSIGISCSSFIQPDGTTASTLQVPTGATSAGDAYLCIILSESAVNALKFLDSVKVSVGTVDPATHVTVWDPETISRQALVVPMDLQENAAGELVWGETTSTATDLVINGSFELLRMYAFPLNVALPSNSNSIRFTYSGPEGTLDYASFIVLGFGVSAGLPGNTAFALTYMNTNAQAESRPRVLNNLGGLSLAESGMSQHAGSKIKIPIATEIAYTPVIPAPAVSQADARKGNDRLLVYTQLPGESAYYLREGLSRVMCVPNTGTPGEWTIQSPWSAFSEMQFIALNDTTQYSPRYAGVLGTSPSDYQDVTPRFTASAVIAGRLLVSSGSDLYVSDAEHSFRHTQLAVSSDGSALTTADAAWFRFPSETVTAIGTTASSMYGAQQSYAFTTRGMYAIDLGNLLAGPSDLGGVGCLAPRSLTFDKSAMWLYDSEEQISRIAGGYEPLSRQVVENLLTAPSVNWFGERVGIPSGRASSVCVAQVRDRLYVGLSQAHPTTQASDDSTNRKLLVYDQRTAGWTEWTTPSGFDAAQLLPIRSGNATRLIAFGASGRVFELLSSGSTDFGSVSIAIGFRSAWYGDAFSPVYVGRVGAWSDTNSTAMTIAWTGAKQMGNPATTYSLRLSDSGGAWVYSMADQSLAYRGVAAGIYATASVSAGWRWSTLVADIQSPSGVGATA